MPSHDNVRSVDGHGTIGNADTVADVGVGNKRYACLVETLPESFIVREKESFVFLNRSAHRSAKLVAAEGRGASQVEKVGRVEDIIPNIFKDGPVPLICSRLRNDRDLRPGMLAVFGAIGIAQHIEFSDRVDSQHLAADAA